MPRTKTNTLESAPRYFRGTIARGLAAGDDGPMIDRDGGMFSAGVIRGFAVITRGEALGHGAWIDDEFLRQTSAALAGSDGMRVRFTHPGMSSDGLGRKLGRAVFAGRDGDIVRADLHFSKTSHTTPEGDLAEYVMSLADEDPEQFGASIVYEYDYHAEREHWHAHVNPETGEFESPDPLNKKNLPHARLSNLRAVDIVDEPAANPGGMFHASEIPAEADVLMAYALGLSDDKPGTLLGIDPDRLRGFASRFMSYRGLAVVETKGLGMPKLSDAPPTEQTTEPADQDDGTAATEPETAPETPAEPEGETNQDGEPLAEETPTEPADSEAEYRAKFNAELQRFTALDPVEGPKWFADGLSYEAAQGKLIEKLRGDAADKDKKLAAKSRGEAAPVSFSCGSDEVVSPSDTPINRFASMLDMPSNSN